MDRKNGGTIAYLACRVTAMLQLSCEVNKFMLVCIILFIRNTHY